MGTAFNDNKTLDPEFYNLDWMRFIPDETPVSAISIPGTHESLSLHGGPLDKCQVWTLKDQLNVGIRYFEMHAGIWLPTLENPKTLAKKVNKQLHTFLVQKKDMDMMEKCLKLQSSHKLKEKQTRHQNPTIHLKHQQMLNNPLNLNL
ncbi:uncharacterized protein LOC115016051 [Cottoperca gobio]|uniref:Uncharacterized protein LOC115016051 n=1 Tax=Cottoperca gobio TaxID=56716 RepID=A0A6J2QPB8_COTGO|nr:uncharacterized protein LOC115016051 [Cottoperca gobio]